MNSAVPTRDGFVGGHLGLACDDDDVDMGLGENVFWEWKLLPPMGVVKPEHAEDRMRGMESWRSFDEGLVILLM